MSNPALQLESGPAPAEVIDRSQVLTYGEFTEQLVANPNLSGEEIVDQFIGDLVAGNGVVTSKLDHRGPAEVLGDIEAGVEHYRDARKRGVTPTTALQESYLLHSSQNGLRQAVVALAGDRERVASLMPGIASRIKQGRDGITLTSGAQIYGYIDGLARRSENPAEAERWATQLKQGMWYYANSAPADQTALPWEQAAREQPYGRHRWSEFNGAVDTARQSSLDPELLRRSAIEWHHQVQQELATARGVGAAAVQ